MLDNSAGYNARDYTQTKWYTLPMLYLPFVRPIINRAALPLCHMCSNAHRALALWLFEWSRGICVFGVRVLQSQNPNHKNQCNAQAATTTRMLRVFVLLQRLGARSRYILMSHV